MAEAESIPIVLSAPPQTYHSEFSSSGSSYAAMHTAPSAPPSFYLWGSDAGDTTDTEEDHLGSTALNGNPAATTVTVESSTSGRRSRADDSTRTLFRKVFSLLTLQLIIILAATIPFRLLVELRQYVQQHPWSHYSSFVVLLVVYVVVLAFDRLRRQRPSNLLLLLLLALSIAHVAATLTAFYETDVVWVALGICVPVSLLMVLCSFCGLFELTLYSTMLISSSAVVVLFGVFAGAFALLLETIPVLIIVYASALALCIFTYLTVDLHLVLQSGVTAAAECTLQLYADVAFPLRALMQHAKRTQREK